MASEQFIKIRNLIEKEFSHAVTKHPKFCDHFIASGRENSPIFSG